GGEEGAVAALRAHPAGGHRNSRPVLREVSGGQQAPADAVPRMGRHGLRPRRAQARVPVGRLGTAPGRSDPQAGIGAFVPVVAGSALPGLDRTRYVLELPLNHRPPDAGTTIWHWPSLAEPAYRFATSATRASVRRIKSVGVMRKTALGVPPAAQTD